MERLIAFELEILGAALCLFMSGLVAERDLRARSAPLLSGEIVVNPTGADLAPGDVIRLRSDLLGLADVVMRISEIGQGDGRDNGIRLKIAEDVFALGSNPRLPHLR
ncbi:MAG: hypothetical protein ACI9AQ_000617 [Dinoroseobacter sp.]